MEMLAAIIKQSKLSRDLTSVIKPKDRSDVRCFANICKWAGQACTTAEKFDDDKFMVLRDTIISLARETNSEGVKNRAAVFVSLMKSELGYEPPTTRSIRVRKELTNGKR